MFSTQRRLPAAVSISGENQLVGVPGLERRVTGIPHEPELRLRPGAMQIPSAGRRTDDVVSALNYRRRNIADARHIIDQLAFAAQDTAIDEIMAFDPGDGQREMILAPFLDVVDVAVQEAECGLPHGPGARGGQWWA